MENSNKTMNRREALRRTAMVMGTALSASTIAGIMQGCKAEPEIAWTPTFFDEPQAKFVSLMSETIIPRTATPGAREVGVPKFIEDMVGTVGSEEQQREFISGLQACQAWCKEQAGDDFIYLDAEKQLELVQNLDASAKAQRFENADTSEKDKQALDFFWTMKELTVTGFFTSEVGASQVLQYKAIPTEYHGCVPLSEVGKTWAT